jgi:hypothetical protein
LSEQFEGFQTFFRRFGEPIAVVVFRGFLVRKHGKGRFVHPSGLHEVLHDVAKNTGNPVESQGND